GEAAGDDQMVGGGLQGFVRRAGEVQAGGVGARARSTGGEPNDEALGDGDVLCFGRGSFEEGECEDDTARAPQEQATRQGLSIEEVHSHASWAGTSRYRNGSEETMFKTISLRF